MLVIRRREQLTFEEATDLATLLDSAIEALSCALGVVTPGVATREVARRRSRLMHLAQKVDRIRRSLT